MAKHKSPLYCSFCRKDDKQVEKLIAGPGVYICDVCVGLCNRILAEQPPAGAAPASDSEPSPAGGDAPRGGGSAFLGWDSLGISALLAALRPSVAAVEAVRAVLHEQIELLRTRGVSWAQIGSALGISRQAAWERFA